MDGSLSPPTPDSPQAPSPASPSSTDTAATPGVPAHEPDSDAKANETVPNSVQLSETSLTADPRTQLASEVLERVQRGVPYREICAELKLSIASISDIARKYTLFDTEVMPRLMAQRAPEMLDRWAEAAETGAKAGKHAAARDWLIHAKALEPVDTSTTSTGAKVAIIIGMPGQPVAVDSAQVIDITAVSTRSDE